MRGGLSAIQQTLTPEAARVLTHSISAAARRNHGQTTPLHVAATLLASPTGLLRRACIRAHPNSSHPLQCRALELCFSVALDRVPTAHGGGPIDPPISNALVAALKRAQAYQRRGCPEQLPQQQPILGVKVEIEQLIVSILDDPSVSRVMREASFSSPAVKAVIEQFLNSQPNSEPIGPGIGLGLRHRPQPEVGLGSGVVQLGCGVGGERNSYLNPRLQQQLYSQMMSRVDDVNKVLDIMSLMKKRNPVIVDEYEPQEVVKEVLFKIEKDEIRDIVLKGVEVISIEKELGLDKGQLPTKLKELGELIGRKLVVNSKGGSGVVVDLGDLKWLVDQPSNEGVSEVVREAVLEMGKILRKFDEGGKVWYIGRATCETYLKCQVYHPTMESEWDIQVVSIVARPPMPGMLPRLGSNGGILSTSIECLSPVKGFVMPASPLTRRVSENLDPLRKFSCCPHCTEMYGNELAKLEAEQVDIGKPLAKVQSDGNRPSLSPWLQNAKLNTDTAQSKEHDLILRQKTQELQKKWSQTCLQLHPSFHHNLSSERIIPLPLSMTGLYNPSLLMHQSFQPRNLRDVLRLNISSPGSTLVDCCRPKCTPGSPVRTDLALGPMKLVEASCDDVHKDRLKDFLGCNVNDMQSIERPVISGDVDSFKRLLKGLIEKVPWQTDAAFAIASAITQCKLAIGKPRVAGLKGDIWLLFSGPDRIGKKKMAVALSELLYGVGPIMVGLSSRLDDDETDLTFRGKTVIDRIAEAVRRNPFSVIMLQDIDEADLLVRGSIKRAVERGRLIDSHGREINLGNVIFVVTSTWMPGQLEGGLSSGDLTLDEEKPTSLASGGWQLKISIGEKITRKRSPSWLNGDEERSTKQRKESGQGISFDLNQIADNDEVRLDGSHNSSDLTVEDEEEHGDETKGSLITSSPEPNELLNCVDEAIIFKPVNFAPIRDNIKRTISSKILAIVGENTSVKIESEALEKILSGIWLGQLSLESWVEKVLVPSIQQLKTTLPSFITHSPDRKMSVQLELDQESKSRDFGAWLPSRVLVVNDVQ